jgi:hypothetical protein
LFGGLDPTTSFKTKAAPKPMRGAVLKFFSGSMRLPLPDTAPAPFTKRLQRKVPI